MTIQQETVTTQQEIEDILDTFNKEQLDFITVRLHSKTDKEAAAAVGITPHTVGRWKRSGVKINRVLELYSKNAVELVMERINNNLMRAMDEIVEELNHRSADVRHRAAITIIEYGLGKPVQRNINNDTGEVKLRWVNDWRNTTSIPAPGTESNPVPNAEI